MSAHLLYETATGQAVSIASRDDGVANPLPAYLTDLVITDQEFNDYVGGWIAWDAATLTFVPTGKLTPAEEAQQVANKSAIETNIGQDLVAMQAIIDDTNANINSNPAARIKDMARMLRRLGKHELEQFETAE